MRKGFFVSLEGPDGSGKSTQTKYLKEYFESRNIDAIFTREPGGTAIGEKLRTIILDKENAEMSDMTEALIYAASRAQHVHQVILPALNKGMVVVCDRFIDSSIAYQGYGRNLGDCVRIINEFAVSGCLPDMTIMMALDPCIGKTRISSENFDRLEMERIEFHNRVFAGYKELADRYKDRFVVIDGSKEKEEIREDIMGRIEEALKDRGY